MRLLLAGILLIIPAYAMGQATVSDVVDGLKGVTGYNPGEIRLSWTAPGDNGYTGQATGYDLRYISYTSGPIKDALTWNNAIRLTGEPPPSPAGGRDSILISGLPPGASYYFCLRTHDDVGNYSVLSNSPLLTVGNSISCSYIPGDVNADGAVNLLDITFLIGSIYKSGKAPYPALAGDVNGSGEINLMDITTLIRYVYYNGPPPVCRN